MKHIHIRIIYFLLLILFIITHHAMPPVVFADTPGTTQISIEGYNIYSPEILFDTKTKMYTMWFSGWLSKDDSPYDRIYYSTSTNRLTWSKPIEVLHASNAQLNDPSVVRLPSGTYVMFYTYLPYRPPEVRDTSQDPDCQNQSRIMRTVYKSESTDGIHWGNTQEVIRRNNGFSACGAWSPSVIYEQDTYSVYYSDEPGTRVLLTTLDTHFSRISTRAVLNDTTSRLNEHVIKQGSVWHMFYNAANGSRTSRIERIQSQDGLSWDTTHPTVLVSTESDPSQKSVHTPFALFDPDNPHTYYLYFGFGDQSKPQSAIHQWHITMSSPDKSLILLGDINGDSHINIDDFNLMLAGFGTKYTIFDYNNLVTNYGK